MATARRPYGRRRVGAAAKAAALGASKAANAASLASAAPLAAPAIPPAPDSAPASTAAPLRRLSSQMKLHVHGPEFQNGDELVLNPEFFPELKELALNKYVVEIFHASESQRQREESAVQSSKPFSDVDYKQAHDHLLLEVPPSSATPIKGKLQVSVFKDTASTFLLAPFNDVTVRFIEKRRVEVEFVEISLKDQFLSRRDLWYLKQSLVGMALHTGKNVRVQGTRWQVMDLRAGGEAVRSGVVSNSTKFAFRSRTSRVMWLLQMSPEMWEMANSGMLYLEILLQVVQNVLHKWIKHKVSHSLTIILFGRNYYPELDGGEVGYGALSTPPRSRRSTMGRVLHHVPPSSTRRGRGEPSGESAFPFSGKSDDMFAIGVDEDGRHYQDFYKVVAFDSAVTEVQSLLVQLKREMNEFPHLCGWRSPSSQPTRMPSSLPGQEDPQPGAFPALRRGIPSNARDGNILEAINLVLNIFEKHHIDRHLARSGQSVVLITAGNGIFRVKQRLAEITEQRMMDHGIGIDMVSLSTPPLHKCPLFLFKQSEMSELTLPSRVDGMEAIGGGGNEICTCSSTHPTNVRASTYVRRSRTGSNDLGTGTDQQHFPDYSIRGGQQALAQAPPSSQGLCKHCVARLAERKRYEVPLWIPLSFVQERMMIDHRCPLDTDITSSCSICCPFLGTRKEMRGFEPLPMSRMFTDIATWQDPPRSSRPLHSSLPKPLDLLINRFKEPEDAFASKHSSYQDDSDDFDDFIHTRTFSSDLSLMLDNDYLSLGRDSELVRARAPSLASLDDSEVVYGSAELPKVRSFSPQDMQRYRREFENYDDAVFSAPAARAAMKQFSKPNGGEDDQSGNVARICLTPPLRPSNGHPPSRKSVSRAVSTGIFHHSGSAGANEEAQSTLRHQTSSGDRNQNRWRSPHHPSVTALVLSPGAPNRSSVHSDSKIRPTSDGATSVNRLEGAGGAGETEVDGVGEDSSSPEMSLSRTRTLGGSLPNTFQLLAAGDGGTYANSPILLPLSEGNSKDDLFHSHAYIYKQLTSNQRRWSQVRPNDGKNPYRLVQSVLKWKSLCFPALLPLTTDFVPGPKELQKHYTESFYSVTLPERDEQSGVTFKDYRELVMEMVAQRFSQDFQLVTMEAAKPNGRGRGVVFRLSMGHRIHEIMYNEETQTVDVKRYLQRASARSDVDTMEYRYSLWSPVAESFLFATQEFRKYPRHEYQWNYLDHLICGYYDDMNDAIRYKRILFCVIPPQLRGNDLEDEAALKTYTDRCRKFIDFLKSKAGDPAMFPSIRIGSEWRSGIHRSGAPAFKHVSRENVKVVLHASDSPTSQNWLVTRLDTELLATQCFHIEVQWLVCRSALVEDFIQGLVRRAKQLGLEFLQVAENGISNDLDLHPLICPIFLPLREPSEQRIVEAALVDRLNFCCEALHVIPRTHLNHEDEYSIIDSVQQPANERRRVRFYRQYIHRSYACFVRVTQTGVVWISNRKLQCRDTQPIYEAIRELIASVRAAHDALEDVMSNVMGLVDERHAAAKGAEVEAADGEKENIEAAGNADAERTAASRQEKEAHVVAASSVGTNALHAHAAHLPL